MDTIKILAETVTFILLYLYFSSIIHSGANEWNSENPTVTIKNETLKGIILHSVQGKPYVGFLGIPYAKPPVGELRLQPPQPVESRNGIKDATKDGPVCPQLSIPYAEIIGDEDCLYLNVYSPQNNSQTLPVMVMIHGGGFFFGSGTYSTYNPAKFMETNRVVLVTFNYRLEALGFLSTGDKVSPGNYGMLDQIQALRWVQENIVQFGGDSQQVTIFGESAGGTSVSLIYLSPLSKGLFHGAIAQSGSALNPWAVQRNPLKWAQEIAKNLKCPTETNLEMVSCIKKSSTENILKASSKSKVFGGQTPLVANPVVERAGDGSGFLTEDPFVTLENMQLPNKVPYITGIVKDEGFLHSQMVLRHFNTTGKEFFDKDFPENVLEMCLPVKEINKSYARDLTSRITKEYYLNKNDLNDKHSFTEIFAKIFADCFFNIGVDLILQHLSRAGVPTYAYKFNYLPQIDFETPLGIERSTHINHAVDVAIQFYSNLFPTDYSKESKDDIKMARILNNLWINFATSMKPTFANTPVNNAEWLIWLKYQLDKPYYMELSLNPKLKVGFLSTNPKLWNDSITTLFKENLNHKAI